MPAAAHNVPGEGPELERLVVFGYRTTDRPGEVHTLLTHGFTLERAVTWCLNVHGDTVEAVDQWDGRHYIYGWRRCTD